MRCLVTGASGFLGSWLVRQLLQEGHSVTVLMREESFARKNLDWLKNVSIVRGTIADLAGLRGGLEHSSIDVFSHLAWFGVTSEFRNHTDQLSANVVGSIRLWELARDIGCKHWIGVGSQAEYGHSKQAILETFAPNPVTAYGVAKLATGMLTRKMAELSGMRHTWVRLFAAYGPGDDPRHFIPLMIHALLAGVKPSLTKGEQVWDYLYVADAADVLCRIATTEATGIFNLASGNTSSIRGIVEMLRDYINPDMPLGFGDIPYSPGQVMHLEGDVTSLRKATNWFPATDLVTGLRKTVDWYRGCDSDLVDRLLAR